MTQASFPGLVQQRPPGLADRIRRFSWQYSGVCGFFLYCAKMYFSAAGRERCWPRAGTIDPWDTWVMNSSPAAPQTGPTQKLSRVQKKVWKIIQQKLESTSVDQHVNHKISFPMYYIKWIALCNYIPFLHIGNIVSATSFWRLLVPNFDFCIIAICVKMPDNFLYLLSVFFRPLNP